MMEGDKISKGILLIAEPFMWDPNFKRTVTLICEHNNDHGTFGFVLNRPLEMKLHEAIQGIKKFDARLHYGGPVELDTLHFLHRLGDSIEGTVEVVEGIYWGGNFEQLKYLINSGTVSPSDFRFFLGYSGWSAGQLEEEMKQYSWIIHQAESRHVFSVNSSQLWKTTLREKGGEYAQMANYPEDPSFN
jgi:putative transcriptional regulator